MNQEEIINELNNYKPIVFDTVKGFLFNQLIDRQFEMIIYHIFKEDIKCQVYQNKYDSIDLIHGTSDRGKDIILYHKSEVVGIIQCKNYQNKIIYSMINYKINISYL